IERAALHHPGLLPTQMLQSNLGRTVLVTGRFGESLRGRLRACRAAGTPGIPRPELVGTLDRFAQVLDALHTQYGCPHLGLTPDALWFQEDQVRVAEFGLLEPLCRSAGQPLAGFNPG